MDGFLRASDADRETVAERLRRGMGEGRLTVAELEERVGAAYQVATQGELEALVADLPLAGEPPPSVSLASRVRVRPGQGGTRWIVSVMGAADRRGRWRLAARCWVVNLMGGSELDLADVELAAERVQLTVLSVMGVSRIRVPASVNVEVSKLSLMGGHDVDLGGGPTDPGGPVVRLRLVSIMGGAEVRRTRGPLGSGARRRRLGAASAHDRQREG